MATLINGNGFPIVSRKQQPNNPCKCGSGKKAKKCCGADADYFYTKLNPKQEREKAEREKANSELKAE